MDPEPVAAPNANELAVSDLSTKLEVDWAARTAVLRLSGLAGTDSGDLLASLLNGLEAQAGYVRAETGADVKELVVDVRDLEWCYSAGVKAMISYGWDRPSRAALPLVFLSNPRVAWQSTALVAMGRMLPNCKIEVCAPRPLTRPADDPVEQAAVAAAGSASASPVAGADSWVPVRETSLPPTKARPACCRIS